MITVPMNRLAVYSYLTRYIHRNIGFGRLFTLSLTDNNNLVQAPALDEKWDKVTQEAARKQAGPLFQDLTSGWKQPESDNNCLTSVCWDFVIKATRGDP